MEVLELEHSRILDGKKIYTEKRRNFISSQILKKKKTLISEPAQYFNTTECNTENNAVTFTAML